MREFDPRSRQLLVTFLITMLCICAGFILVRYALTKKLPYVPPIISIATTADYPPFSFIGNGELVGFDIDLGKEIVYRLGKQFTIHDVPFELIFIKVHEGEYSMAIGGITPTANREKLVLFSKPYLGYDPLMIVSRSDAKKLENLLSLEGKNIGVTPGYTSELWLKTLKNIKISAQPSLDDCVLALKSGTIDAFVATAQNVRYMLERLGDTNFNVMPLPDVNENYAIAVDQAYPVLRDSINRILSDMESDGTLQKIKDTWHVR